MAQERKRKAEISKLLAERRQAIRSRRVALRESMSIESRVENFYRSHTIPTLLASSASGFLLGRLVHNVFTSPKPEIAHKKHKAKHAGLKAFVFTSFLAAAKPLVKTWIVDQTKIQVRKRLNRLPDKSTLGVTENL